MSATSILAGAILTFASTDGRALQLTVSLTRPATAAIAWGDIVRTATTARVRHLFRDLPAPEHTPLAYTISIAREAPRRVLVDPIGSKQTLRIGVYGDSRNGSAPHRMIVAQMAEHDLDVIVHTGDVVESAADEEGWANHLSATLPLSERRPVILSLGNHELSQAGDGSPWVDGLTRAMQQIPPPDDPVARESGAPIAAYHVRVGPALFVTLDANQSLAPSSPQVRFLERALETKGNARYVFVAYHQGPLSSGPHGPLPDGDSVIRLLEENHVTASLSGHDHIYERLVRGGITYLVSGGGGAPLYTRTQLVQGSEAFAATYNWVLITIDGEHVDLEAFSVEGATLDRARIVPPPVPHESHTTPGGARRALGSVLLLLVAFGYAVARIARYRPA